MLIIALIALFYIAVSAMAPHQTVPVDKDVGYSLTIDQNVLQFDVIVCNAENYQITRGVSVPCKISTMDAITYFNTEKTNFPVCRVDNYSPIWQRSISTNYKLVTDKQMNQHNQGVFRLDIGETLFS